MNDDIAPVGPDFALGVPASDIADGARLAGHVDKKEVLLVRRGEEFFAVDARCTHYHGPLAEGILVADTVRCPWHHARFDLRTGEAIGPPALSPLKCWDVDHSEGKVYVRRRRASAGSQPRGERRQRADPEKIVVVGGGAAGFAAIEMLRREQYQGSLAMLSADSALPVDRPNLSKDYLAGSAPEDWLPLRPESFYSKNDIDLRLDAKVVDIDPRSREITLGDGSSIGYDRLLLATGAEPRPLPLPGSDRLPVLMLRSLADCRTIIRHAQGARRAVVIGASFIGLEVAAALRARAIEVHVVAPEKRPMERILGPRLGEFIRAVHEEHGVVFHLEDEVRLIDGSEVRLRSGHTVNADLVVAGIGVRPRIELAERAGLATDGGVIADAFLASNVPDIFVAGDIARWPDPHSGESIRVEHWVVAQRQGQTAARNMLGYRERFTAVPFFWSQHYDLSINYVGHAAKWDEITIEGDIASRDCVVRFKNKGRSLAVASIFRDVDSLEAELAMERCMA